MAITLTLDSSVIIAALREQEKKHTECITLLEKIKNAEYVAVEPYTTLVEIVAAIRRRTGSKQLAERVKNNLQEIDSIYFLDLLSPLNRVEGLPVCSPLKRGGRGGVSFPGGIN